MSTTVTREVALLALRQASSARKATSVAVPGTLAGFPAAAWTDSYSRALWQAGDMNFNHNVVMAWSGTRAAPARSRSSLSAAEGFGMARTEPSCS